MTCFSATLFATLGSFGLGTVLSWSAPALPQLSVQPDVRPSLVWPAGSTLRLDLERFNSVDLQLQVEKQKTEEMNSVIKMKNDHLHQLLDEYDHLQHQLEIEVFRVDVDVDLILQMVSNY